jgi:superoxide reductase
MAKQKQIFKCNVCGHIIEVLHPGVGELVCCNQPMALAAEKTEDEGREKHQPIIEKTESGVKIKVGSIPHPMTAEHYIEWIEIFADGRSYKKFLNPGDAPEAEFCLTAEKIEARAYCNVHGLWQNG